MKFTYRSGQCPLPGYAIKRGIGWGGFGEVYFAVTTGGKEVALKWVRGNLDVELRGIQQCLNLKHPNLVHLYDLQTDTEGHHWLVMEYVAGEPLSIILARHPSGVAPELASQWFTGLAQAVHYLHEHGIVHRDLKPGNIFLENGLIKVGDYGLCKFIGESHRAGLTKDVGTVHYMAPEISTGNYNRQIDVYAAGVVLYEMLTGRVPFDGESAGEILMKHMTSAPELHRVPAEFRPILELALHKNPAQRYQSITEMSKKVAAAAGVAEPACPQPAAPSPRRVAPIAEPIPTVLPVVPTMRERWSELSGMLLWAFAFSTLLALAWGYLFGQGQLEKMLNVFYLTLAGSWAVLIPSKLWPVTKKEESWSRRLLLMTLGFGVGLYALWLQGYELPLPWTAGDVQPAVLQPWSPVEEEHTRSTFYGLFGENRSMPVLACYLSYFGLAFLMLRWWKTTETTRGKRFSLKPVLAAGFWAFALMFLLPSVPQREPAFVALTLTAAVCQLASPWKETVPVKNRKLRLARA